MMSQERTFLHVDMDAFFAAVEQRERPELRGRPVVVGAAPDARGVVATCSYEARVFGIHSAMPSRTAYQLCPQAVFVPVCSALYQQVSQDIFRIFGEFSPFVEKLSIDEAFLDISGCMHLFGGAVETAQALRSAIRAGTELTASVGIASNKFLAKLASDMDKPDGLTLVPREQKAIEAFLAPLPIRRIWGIGAKTGAILERAGLSCIGDLQRVAESDLQQLLGKTAGSHVHRLAFGRDNREIHTESVDKSISHEHTFGEDTRDWQQLERVLLQLVEKVGSRLRARGLRARTAHLKLRWTSFKTITRQLSMNPPEDCDRELIAAANTLLARECCRRAVRLIGFGVSGLETSSDPLLYQPDLFDNDPAPERDRNRHLDSAVDDIRRRFGSDSLRRGRWGERKPGCE